MQEEVTPLTLTPKVYCLLKEVTLELLDSSKLNGDLNQLGLDYIISKKEWWWELGSGVFIR